MIGYTALEDDLIVVGAGLVLFLARRFLKLAVLLGVILSGGLLDAHLKLTGCKMNLKCTACELEAYAGEHEGHYPESLSQIHYRQRGSCVYNYSVAADVYTVTCVGWRHYGLERAPDHPFLRSDTWDLGVHR